MSSIYEKLPPDFFDSSQNAMNPVTAYYHRSRYLKIRRFIGASFREGQEILDIGSGSASWNTGRLPVTGLDQNEAMLEYGKGKGYLRDSITWDLGKVPLPVPDGSFDYIVISEVLEHLDEPQAIIRESFRILRRGGLLIATVPLDTPFSAWNVLFSLNCFLLGDLLGNEYYRNRCGHVQHFSARSISALMENEGFGIVGKDVTVLNIGLVAKKPT